MKNLLLLLLFFNTSATCQQISSGKGRSDIGIVSEIISADSTKYLTKNDNFYPVPKKATRLALIPGFGQIYNRDYWKLPIIYLSIGGGVYSYYLNNLKYQNFLTSYKAFYDLDKNNLTYGQLKPGITLDSGQLTKVANLFNTKSAYIKLSRDIVERQKNYWRRNRNLSLIVTGIIYSLSIIEANVAAHLKTFDLSDDLTLRVEPKLSQPLIRQTTPGVRLVFNFH